RHVYSLANWDSSRTVIPTGTSGIPSSRYYCDQTRTYVKNQYHGDLFSKRAVKQNVRHQMTIDGD
ncbi:MAG: penicillin acylase family protein, partial [Candidatus Cloacimonetes bacterium]|nr:penicillin acylase family protein [Candidatus Cloacimonadota bacterium]